ncbi:hypothetical protein KI387_044423, partial [Taxus chinensis]
ALMVQSISSPSESAVETATQDNQTPLTEETTLVNWKYDDFCGLNANASSVASNTRSKKRAIEQKSSKNNQVSSSHPQTQVVTDKYARRKSLEVSTSQSLKSKGPAIVTMPNKISPKENTNIQNSISK